MAICDEEGHDYESNAEDGIKTCLTCNHEKEMAEQDYEDFLFAEQQLEIDEYLKQKEDD